MKKTQHLYYEVSIKPKAVKILPEDKTQEFLFLLSCAFQPAVKITDFTSTPCIGTARVEGTTNELFEPEIKPPHPTTPEFFLFCRKKL
ncbi:hypothetical protein DOY81_003013 [Sarcophaga bullata]|nr:hypothetical protein DOY81_003013 [Sarcophaga bullata]